MQLVISAKTKTSSIFQISHQNATDITIGNDVKIFIDALNSTAVNKALTPNVNYCFNFIFNNTYQDMQAGKYIHHTRVYHQKDIVLLDKPEETNEEAPTNAFPVASIIVLTLLVILLIAVVVFGIICYK